MKKGISIHLLNWLFSIRRIVSAWPSDVIDGVPKLQSLGAPAKERFRNQQLECRTYAYENGIDKPEIVHWKWTDSAAGTKNTITPKEASTLQQNS